MQAVVCRKLGDPSDLRLEEMPSAPLAAGEVRIGVKAAGVNFPDILMVQGRYQVKPDLPLVPGLEVAGEVLECGAGVAHLEPGQRVLAFARSGGGYASEIVLPGAIVTPIPDAMDYVTAAAFPVAYGTAHFALDYRGHLRAGETLAVLGAAGGVGIAAVEVGKLLGARVIAAARGDDKLAIVREHGADETIDYSRESLRDRLKELTAGAGVDVVFDPVGGACLEQCQRAMAWEGRLLVIGFASGEFGNVASNLVLVKNFSVIGVVFGAHSQRFPDEFRKRLGVLLEHWSAGHLKPRVHRTWPLGEAPRALAQMSERRVTGKMVLTV